MNRPARLMLFAVLATLATLSGSMAARQRNAPDPHPPAVRSLRLYVMNCGQIMGMDPKTWGYQPGEIAHPDAAVVCHLIVHPKGTLIWDTGVVPDEEIGTGGPRSSQAGPPLRGQLAALGYTPADITYLALSHYHVDHAANANMFKASTWLVRQAERDIMFGDKPPAVGVPKNYSELKNSKTIIIDTDEYDVFGDGQVIIKAAPGHTPGHQVLILKLKKTGPVMLAGDLYHFPEQRHTDHVPTFEFDKALTLKSRAAIEDYVKRTGTQFWIEHDWVANSRLRKAPLFYE
jgi:glyoxylase-like metal-dependent hydrolase (beta-lactamase superfamily II)